MKLRIVLPLMAAAVLVLAAPVAMASSTGSAYGKPGSDHSVPTPKTHVLGSEHSGTPTATATPTGAAHATNQGGSLPFTGFDLLLVGGVGIVLLGLGLVLRRMTVRSEPLN